MKKYLCNGFRSAYADTIREAAEIFAGRAARKAYGSRAYVRTCNLQSWSNDGSAVEFEAFIGYRSGPQETTGRNFRFTVFST